MPKPLFRSPRNLITQWPEVFEDLYINAIPINYIDIVRLEFANGRIWEININEQTKSWTNDYISSKLLETFEEYSEEISYLDFKVDIKKLKKDIEDSTKKLL